MSKSVLTALVFLSLGILFIVLAQVKFENRKELFRVADFRATLPVQRKYPVLRYIGFAFLGGGAVFLIQAVKRR